MASGVSWRPAEHLHGAKWDHALVSVKWKWRVRAFSPTTRRDLRTLRDVNNPACKLFEKSTADWLEASGFWRESSARPKYCKLVQCWGAVRVHLPTVPETTRRNSILSNRTKKLFEQRRLLRARPGGVSKEWSHKLDRVVSRSRRKDTRDFQAKLVKQAFMAEKRNDKAEASRLVRVLTQKPRRPHWQRQPTIAPDGSPIITDSDLVKVWTKFRSDQFRKREISTDSDSELSLQAATEDSIRPTPAEEGTDETIGAAEESATSSATGPVRAGTGVRTGANDTRPDDEAFPESDWVKTIDRIKLNKATGWDSIPGEVFKFSKAWRDAAEQIARDMWKEEALPEEMLLAVMRNLRKARSSAEKLGNYRPVSLLVSTYKIFSTMIYLRLLREVERYINKWQAGFRQRRGYVDNVVVLLEILRQCAEAGQRVYAFKADIEKAFDSIDHEALFDALRRAGASRKTIALIKDIYAKAKAVIRFGRACGDIFKIGRGVLEGDIISALLFILTLEVVFRQVGEDDCAPELGGVKIPQIGFADDVIMLTLSPLPVFQNRVNRVDNCLQTKGLNFSKQKGKCVLMHGGPAQSVPKPTAEDIDKLKLKKHACSYCGERRFVNLAGKLQHERTCDLGRDILHSGRFDVDCILDARGPPEMRYYQV